MSENLITGCLVISVNLAIQCVVVALLLKANASLGKKRIALTLASSSLLLAIVLLIMLAGNLLQITLWAALFLAYKEFGSFAVAFYHSAVNFTTLAYGDMVMSDKKRLLGALEAANGVLMFGLTTSVLYSALSVLMRRSLERTSNRKLQN